MSYIYLQNNIFKTKKTSKRMHQTNLDYTSLDYLISELSSSMRE